MSEDTALSQDIEKKPQATIYSPAKSAMQSGKANLGKWLVEFEQIADNHRFIEPIMGWTGSADMNQELRLKFQTKEEAIGYAERNNIDYTVIEPKKHKAILQSYADNFI